jgi:beta-carotene hydroxylase
MDQLASTIRQEAEVGRRHTPEFGGRTLLLELELFVLFFASTGLTVAGLIPMWAGALGNTIFIYALYTVVHEAVHSNISSRRKNLRWIDPVAGIIACAPLFLNYHQHKRQHMAHHAHTNEETDPDIYARGSFLGWIFLRLPLALLNYFNPVQQYRDCQRFNCTRREYVYTGLSFSGPCFDRARLSCCRLLEGGSVSVVRALVDRADGDAHLLHLDPASRSS